MGRGHASRIMSVDLRPVFHLTGRVTAFLGATMVIPAAVDLWRGDPNWQSFVEAAAITGVIGALLARATAGAAQRALDLRQAFLLTVVFWITLSAFGSLPFLIGEPDLGLTDAFFESVSGLTTTGSTVIVGLDDLPVSTNLWRGMLNWMGGLGIAYVAMIFLPIMRVGGMQFFKTQGFDTLGKVLPRAADIAQELVRVYALLTGACVATYLAVGMAPLDALVNGAATIATGGFSPSDSSIGKYPGAAEYAGAVFMLLGSLPYIRYVQLIKGTAQPIWHDAQVRACLRWAAIAVLIVTAWRVSASEQGLESAFREALFNIVSILTGTGFFSGSFAAWGGFALVAAFLVGLIGGCSGSSSGALSIFRVQLILTAIATAAGRIGAPHRVALLRHEGREVAADAMAGVMVYVNGYLAAIVALAILMTLTGVDTESAIFAVWTSIGNIGYGFGPLVQDTGTMVDFPIAAKWIMILAMLMGRLGILAGLVLILPRFWRG